MEHRLEIGETTIIKVRSRDVYSRDFLAVEEGEHYKFWCNPVDFWIDLSMVVDADGFDNILLREQDKRIPGAKCFQLCGCYGRVDERFEIIGQQKEIEMRYGGNFFIFPNDHHNPIFYFNNFGSVLVEITRLG
ncbi:MAG: hypothetical protein MK081_15895 [Flavobacteriales bacterium]|nr:hypothetical protein [Flavobacteriales bacterium]